jgi:hypothetical protein
VRRNADPLGHSYTDGYCYSYGNGDTDSYIHGNTDSDWNTVLRPTDPGI